MLVHKMIPYTDSKRTHKCDYIQAMYMVGQQDEEVYEEVSREKRFI